MVPFIGNGSLKFSTVLSNKTGNGGFDFGVYSDYMEETTSRSIMLNCTLRA